MDDIDRLWKAVSRGGKPEDNKLAALWGRYFSLVLIGFKPQQAFYILTREIMLEEFSDGE